MRLFAQLSWYFRREWRRYLGAVALLAVIAVLQLIPPKVVGIVVDGVTKEHYTAEQVWMWIGALDSYLVQCSFTHPITLSLFLSQEHILPASIFCFYDWHDLKILTL